MTTYITITDAETDPEAPLTSELAKKWRDNPIAIAERDASVPTSLLPIVLLGTLNTTSGTSVTLSGLTLTNYRFVQFFMNGISANDSNALISFGNYIIAYINSAFTSDVAYGSGVIDLATGVFASSSSVYNGSSIQSTSGFGGLSGVTNASTSITFNCSAGDVFDAGSIRVYGVK